MEIHVESARDDAGRIDEELKQQATIKYPDLMKKPGPGNF